MNLLTFILMIFEFFSNDLSKLGSLLPDPSTRHSGLISPSPNRIYLLEGPVQLSTVCTSCISLINLRLWIARRRSVARPSCRLSYCSIFLSQLSTQMRFFRVLLRSSMLNSTCYILYVLFNDDNFCLLWNNWQYFRLRVQLRDKLLRLNSLKFKSSFFQLFICLSFELSLLYPAQGQCLIKTFDYALN